MYGLILRAYGKQRISPCKGYTRGKAYVRLTDKYHILKATSEAAYGLAVLLKMLDKQSLLRDIKSLVKGIFGYIGTEKIVCHTPKLIRGHYPVIRGKYA